MASKIVVEDGASPGWMREDHKNLVGAFLYPLSLLIFA